MKIIVVGDIILDINHYCYTTRNAPEANIPVYNITSTNYLLGGAGNVVKNLKNMDCEVEIVSVVGNDFAGSKINEILVNNNIKNVSFIDKNRKTTQKNRLFSNDILINRHDIEDIYAISKELEECVIQYITSQDNIDAVLFSDYNKGVLTQNMCIELISHCKKNNILTFVDPKPYQAIKYKECFCCKLNLLEGEIISSKKTKKDIIDYLKLHIQCDHVILTCGENGLYVDSIQNHIVSSFPINVVDVTGCGDTVLVVIAYIYLKTKDIIMACKIANHVARKCVSVIGNREISKHDIDDFIDTVIMCSETNKIENISKRYKNIVFTNGCFDIVHSAHIKLLNYAKQMGDILIVGLNTNESVKRLKGNARPINNISERCDFLLSLGIVDYIIVFDDDTPLKILSILKPKIIVKGGDYKKEDIIGREYAEDVVLYEYINGSSSTNIINKINKSYINHT